MIMNGKMKMPKSIDKKYGEYKQEVDKLARRYINICLETKNTWPTYQEDCIELAKKEIGEKYGTKDMEDGNKS